MAGRRIEVAQIVTRFIAGAGGVALRGVLPLDPDRYRVTIITGQGGPLTDRRRGRRDAGPDRAVTGLAALADATTGARCAG